ncbi:30S ribosomal protein S4 [Candidatus Pacearchaeota archaeon]|nr:30S ribosomal protein S4 [Candidatus Pacearchaeota archaeon]
MGDPSRPKKQFSRPLKPFDKNRIQEEKEITQKYGLKNKKEIWKADAIITSIRSQAKKLILNPERRGELFNRLIRMGLIKQDATIDDILALTKERLLDRRLQTFVLKKGLAKTSKEARQLIVHRKIKVNERILTIPGYILKIDEEEKIGLVPQKQKKQKESIQEMAQEISQEASQKTENKEE